MRYVIIAILLYIGFLLIRTILRALINRNAGINTDNTGKSDKHKRTYDLNRVQDAEFREVDKNKD